MNLANELVKSMNDIPILFKEKEISLGDLEDTKKYDVIIRNKKKTKGEIYIFDKTKWAIYIHLSHIGLISRERLDFLDYRIYVENNIKGAK